MRRYIPLLFLLLALACTFIAYQPGLKGAFIFDDNSNIVTNSAIAIQDLNSATLRNVALSSTSGPLRRPISMVSFALNYYTTGLDPYYFKLTNLVIHLLNGIAVFGLSYVLTIAYRQRFEPKFSQQHGLWLSLAISAAWLLHPFNLTGVLYVVQRMASLSTLFTLLGLTLYTWGRLVINKEKWPGIAAVLIGLCVFTMLAVLCKENGALLPVFALVIELCFFKFQAYSKIARQVLIAANIVLILIPSLVAVGFVGTHPHWLLGSYVFRDFNLTERVLTECRVMWFYLRMIVFPQIDQMGLFHDDISISRSLFQPISTLFSALGIVALLFAAWLARRRAPVFSFAVAFFFVGHALESTVFPFEITFEHRNYLPSFGVLFAIFFYLLHPFRHATTLRLRQACAVLLICIFAFGTFQRSLAWSDSIDFARSEVTHHPGSARDAQEMGSVYVGLARKDAEHADAYKALAYDFFKRATENDPSYTGGLFSTLLLESASDVSADPTIIAKLESALRDSPPSPIAGNNLINLIACVDRGECHINSPDLKNIVEAALQNPKLPTSMRAPILSALSLYLVNIAKDYPAALAVMYETVQSSPQDLQYRFSLIKFLRALHRVHEAQDQMAILKRMDSLNEYTEQIAAEEAVLAKTPEAIQH